MPSPKPVLETTPSTNKWDIDGDGQLDEAELALMKLDKENTGQLSKEDMHELMKEHLNSQRELFTFKKIALGLSLLVVIMAVGMLGLSFAAAILAKDTMSTGNDLVDSHSGSTLGMQSTADRFDGETNGESTCMMKDNLTVHCTSTSLVKIDMSHGKAMVEDCSMDRTVHFTHKQANGHEMHHAICPIQEGLSGDFDTSLEYPTATIDTSAGFIVIKPNEEGTYYEITGDGITMDLGYPCDSDKDCDSNLVCNSENKCEAATDTNL